jgi:hypothetical protein
MDTNGRKDKENKSDRRLIRRLGSDVPGKRGIEPFL